MSCEVTFLAENAQKTKNKFPQKSAKSRRKNPSSRNVFEVCSFLVQQVISVSPEKKILVCLLPRDRHQIDESINAWS